MEIRRKTIQCEIVVQWVFGWIQKHFHMPGYSLLFPPAGFFQAEDDCIFLCYTVLLFKLHSEEGRALHKKCKKVVHHWRKKKCCNGKINFRVLWIQKLLWRNLKHVFNMYPRLCYVFRQSANNILAKKVLAKCKITKVLFRHFVTHIKKVTIHSALPPQNTGFAGFVYPMGTTTKLQRWKSALFCTIKLQLAFGYL